MPKSRGRKTLKRQPKTEKAVDTKQTILEASTHILLSKGLEHVNTNAIAIKAGVSIGTLYQYFDDKDEILLEMLGRVLDRRIENVKEAISLAMMLEPVDKIVEKVVNALLDSENEKDARIELMLLPHAVSSKRGLLFKKLDESNIIFLPLLKLILVAKMPSLKKRNLETISFLLMQTTRSVLLGRALYPNSNISDENLKTELCELIMGYLKSSS